MYCTALCCSVLQAWSKSENRSASPFVRNSVFPVSGTAFHSYSFCSVPIKHKATLVVIGESDFHLWLSQLCFVLYDRHGWRIVFVSSTVTEYYIITCTVSLPACGTPYVRINCCHCQTIHNRSVKITRLWPVYKIGSIWLTAINLTARLIASIQGRYPSAACHR